MACHSGATLCDVSHCSVVPLGEFTVMIPEPHATLHNVIIPSATELLKILFRHILFCFFNAVWALTSGGFRIVSDTLVRTSLYVTKLSTNYLIVIGAMKLFKTDLYQLSSCLCPSF